MGRWLPFLILLSPGVVWARPPTPAEYDQQITGELAAVDAHAAELFTQANPLREKEPAKAAPLYEQVEKLAPSFDPALRRHGWVLMKLGRDADAVALMRRALALKESPENQSALAMALTSRVDAPGDAREEAWSLITKAAAVAPEDRFAQATMCQIALNAHHPEEFRTAAVRLRSLAPDEPDALFFGSIEAADRGRWSDAFDELDRAHARGIPDAEYHRLRTAFENATPFWYRWLRPLGFAVGGWIGCSLGLLVIGLVLSALTLRACRRPVTTLDGHVRGVDAWLRRVYARVLWLCAAYFYVSLPLVVLSVVAFAVGVVLLMDAAGFIAFKLIILLGLAVLATLTASVRTLFVRKKDVDPGEKLDLARHPRLRALLDEVAARIGTRPVDAVYLEPGTDVAVVERGGTLAQLRGVTERCLILGVAVLRDFPLGAFQAVLAHEYGHFVNRDTAGGRLGLAVRRSLHAFAITLVRSGAAGWYNPAWWFVVAYERLFLRISHGASRLQEVLADRWAATAYGAEAFEAGLRHVIGAEVRFDAHVQAVVNEKLPVAQVYRLVRDGDGERITTATDERLERAASPYDSHPPPAQRIAWVRALPIDGRATATVPVDAWSLFDDRDAIERQMAEVIRRRAAARGVTLPAEEVAPASA